MKNATILCAAAIGFVAVLFTYSTVKGYTTWFWRNSHGQVLMNGQRVPGYVHQSKHVIIVTRRDTQPPHSYFIVLRGQSQSLLLDCGEWAAPRVFLFALGHVNHPCISGIGDEPECAAPDAPGGPLQQDPGKLEFRTRGGKVIRVLL